MHRQCTDQLFRLRFYMIGVPHAVDLGCKWDTYFCVNFDKDMEVLILKFRLSQKWI